MAMSTEARPAISYSGMFISQIGDALVCTGLRKCDRSWWHANGAAMIAKDDDTGDLYRIDVTPLHSRRLNDFNNVGERIEHAGK